MTTWLFSVFNWIERNPTAQAILFGLGVLFGFKVWGDYRALQGARKARTEAKAQRREDELRTVETVHQLQEEARTYADRAIEARDDAPRYPDAVSVPKHVAERIFRD